MTKGTYIVYIRPKRDVNVKDYSIRKLTVKSVTKQSILKTGIIGYDIIKIESEFESECYKSVSK